MRDTLELINLFVFFHSRLISTAAVFRGRTLAWGLIGDVCVNGRGLRPVADHRTTGTVNRAQMENIVGRLVIVEMLCLLLSGGPLVFFLVHGEVMDILWHASGGALLN